MELRPAHIVIPELLKDVATAMTKECEIMGRADTFRMATLKGEMTMGIKILRNMVIPEKHVREVAEKLKEVKIPSMVKGSSILRKMISNIIVNNLIHFPADAPTETFSIPKKEIAAASSSTELRSAMAKTIAGPAL